MGCHWVLDPLPLDGGPLPWEGPARLVNSRSPESSASGEIAVGKTTPIPVRLWIDPGCPWAWQGALWLRRIAAAGRVEIDWRIFSLELNASEPSMPFWEACHDKENRWWRSHLRANKAERPRSSDCSSRSANGSTGREVNP